jgi:hypothetical protein
MIVGLTPIQRRVEYNKLKLIELILASLEGSVPLNTRYLMNKLEQARDSSIYQDSSTVMVRGIYTVHIPVIQVWFFIILVK